MGEGIALLFKILFCYQSVITDFSRHNNIHRTIINNSKSSYPNVHAGQLAAGVIGVTCREEMERARDGNSRGATSPFVTKNKWSQVQKKGN